MSGSYIQTDSAQMEWPWRMAMAATDRPGDKHRLLRLDQRVKHRGGVTVASEIASQSLRGAGLGVSCSLLTIEFASVGEGDAGKTGEQTFTRDL